MFEDYEERKQTLHPVRQLFDAQLMVTMAHKPARNVPTSVQSQ